MVLIRVNNEAAGTLDTLDKKSHLHSENSRLATSSEWVFSRTKMNTELHLVRFLALALAFCKLFLRVAVAEGEISEEDKIIKDCNGILYRLMVDSGEPPFPDTACDVKQVRTAGVTQTG